MEKTIAKFALMALLIAPLSFALPAKASVNITTNPATTVTSTNATLNGMNGNSAATGHSFWVSLAPFVTTSPTIPSGVYSTPDFGSIAPNTSFSASLSSLTTTGIPTNLPAITPNTTYYFAAWSNVGGTWYPGAILNFKTAPSSDNGGGNGNGDHHGKNEGLENEREDVGEENENENENNAPVISSDNNGEHASQDNGHRSDNHENNNDHGNQENED